MIVRLVLGLQVHGRRVSTESCRGGAQPGGSCGVHSWIEGASNFENSKFSNRVYKLQKTLYGLKQAPRSWYNRLKTFLLAQGFKMGCVDKTLFLMRSGNDFLLVQIYVDDI